MKVRPTQSRERVKGQCPLASPEGVAERSESFKIMIASGNHSKIRKLDFLAIGTSEPIAKKD